MKKITLILFLGLSITNVCAQKFHLSKETVNNPSLLDIEIPEIAKSILKNYTEKDKETYYENKIVLAILSNQYSDALVSIDSLRKISDNEYPKEIKLKCIEFDLYARALMSGTSFSKGYENTFNELYTVLPEEAKLRFSRKFDKKIEDKEKKIVKFLEKQKDKDSIDQNDAIKLSSLYLSKVIIDKSKSIALSLAQKEDAKKYHIQDSISLTMKDGGVAALRIGRSKTDNKPKPTILIYSIYPSDSGIRDDFLVKQAAYYGYNGVVASTRGKRFSPDAIEPFEHDAKDAYEIINWISKQPWSDGQIGMMGGSYVGFSQWAAAKNKPSALKTIVPMVSVGIGVDYPMNNNVFMSYMLQWIRFVTNNKYIDLNDFSDGTKWNTVFYEWYKSGKSFRELDTIEGQSNKVFQRWLDHPDYDKYWQDMAVSEEDFAKIDIPILTTTGYFDADQRGAMHYMKQHLRRNKKANHYFVIGPYTHGAGAGRSSKKIGKFVADSIAKNDMTVLAYQWFDHIMKGAKKPNLLKDRINYQVMGANTWKHKPTLKSMNTDTLTYYLDNVRIGKDYKLTKIKNDGKEYVRQEMDYLDRTDSITNWSHWGPSILEELEIRNDITFTTEPFEESFDINGSFIADLYVEINKKDMDVLMKLYEVLPDGTYFQLSDFLGRASYAKDMKKRQLLIPGNKEYIPAHNTFFVSKRIKKGSRLVFLLGIKKSPFWQINYGTGKNVSDETIEDGKMPLQIKWFSDSTIKIPISKIPK